MIGPILRNLLQNADYKITNLIIIPPFVRTRVYSEIYKLIQHSFFFETSFENISVVYERGGGRESRTRQGRRRAFV